jgi:phosphoserine phosphatase RsbU/P
MGEAPFAARAWVESGGGADDTMRILLVEDDPMIGKTLQQALHQDGYAVDWVRDGEMGRTALAGSGEAYALVLLDLGLPRKGGLELLKELRRAGNRVRVLIVTARDAVADRVAGLDAGADDYLIKPLESEELRARVQVGLRVHALQQRLSEQVAELQEALSKVKQLTGLLPICSYCKSVRTDQNYWERVDHYMTLHTDVQFSHGICPACYETVMARLDKEEADSRIALEQTQSGSKGSQ